MDALELCMGCMGSRGPAEICPRCLYKEGTPPDSPLHLAPRSELHGQYLIGRVLGHGGFGITYLGWDKNLERKLAVKEYFPTGVAMRTGRKMEVAAYNGQLQKDYEYGLERYLEEARIVARFNNHPNILSVLNFFRENGTAYIVMEYLEGVTLEKHLDRMGSRISFEEALALLTPVMEALEEVHEAGILHRDVSPDNIHLGPNRQVKLLDFGAARMALGERSRNLSVILKEGFAPAEQYRTKGLQGPWTDVYALAATMYRATTGQMPPPALDRMSEDDLKPPRELGVPMSEAQEQILLKALAFDARERVQSMKELRVALAPPPLVTRRIVTETPPELPAPPPAKSTNIPAWVWSLLGGGAVLAILFLLRPTPTKPPLVVPGPNPPREQVQTAGEPVPPVKPAAAPAPAAVPAPLRYEELLERARQSEAADSSIAIETLKDAARSAPTRWEAHDLLAQMQLYRMGTLADAAPNYRKALELGGFATFRVLHDRKESTGTGLLRLGKDSISFVDTEGVATFTARTSDVKEIRRNSQLVARFRRAGQGSFHIRLVNGENYNFLGTSGQRIGERDLILTLAGER